jgi:hypothetical protein
MLNGRTNQLRDLSAIKAVIANALRGSLPDPA